MNKARVFALLVSAVSLFSCAKESSEQAKLPAPVVSAVESKCTETSVCASWTVVPDASSYDVQFDSRDVISTTETEMAWDGLEPNSTHTLRVKAVCSGGKFSDSEWSRTVVLNTAEPEPEAGPFTLSFSDITFYDAHVDIKVDGYDGGYFFACTPKLLLDRDYSGKIDSFVADYVAQLKLIAEQSGYEFSVLYEQLKYTGSLSSRVTDLASDTDYVGAVFGVEPSGVISTGIVSASFRTSEDPGVQPSAMKFDIRIENSGETKAKITVVPTVNDEYYFFTALNKARLSEIGGDSDEAIVNYYLRLFAQSIEDDSFEDFARKNFSRGTDSYLYSSLDPDSDYLVVAFGVTWHGNMCVATTDLTRKEFQTGSGAQKPDEENIEFVINKLTSTDIEASIIPSDNDRYYAYDFLDYDNYRALTDEEIMKKFIADMGAAFWYVSNKGVSTKRNINDLVPGKEYILFAFYVEEDPNNSVTAIPSSRLFKQIIIPPTDGGETPQPTLGFTISEDEVAETSFKSTVTPSDNAAKYVTYVVEASQYDGKSDEDIIKGVMNELSYDIYGAVKTGVSTVSKSGLKAGTGYYVVAFGVDDSFSANSRLTKRLVTTKSSAVTPPSEGIEIKVKECTAKKISVDIVSSEPTMEIAANIYKAEKFDGMSDTEILNVVVEDFGYELYYGLPTGSTNITRDAFSPDTEYIVVAFGVKGGSPCTGLYKQTVKTLAE